MIYAICGTPGSFKSCYAVENFVLPALRKGRKVFTNIEGLSVTHIATYYDLDPISVEENLNVLGRVYDNDGTYHEDRDKIRKFYDDLPINALVIIDEAQNYFSSRDFKEGFSADLIPWLTKHRHLGNDVVWITQNIESVDITFRRNTHLTYALRRAENIGFKNAAFNYIFDRADLDRRHLARKIYRPDPTIFKLYSSYQEKDVKENRKSYNVFLRSPFVWLAIIVFCYAGYVIFSGSFSRKMFHSQIEPKNKVEKVQKEETKNQKVETRQEVSNEKDGKTCITKMATVHGEKRFYLSNNSFATVPDGLSFCP
jgi:zona occludens toxin (predicted ATPase)